MGCDNRNHPLGARFPTVKSACFAASTSSSFDPLGSIQSCCGTSSRPALNWRFRFTPSIIFHGGGSLQKLERHHDLDSLRGTMLMLGLVVHASQAYFLTGSGLRDPARWYFYDATGSYLMAPLCGAIHVYRMPVFFVLAGFFAALLTTKRGLNGLIINRANRVAAPLAVSMFTIVPMICIASQYAWSQRGDAPNGFGVHLGFTGMLRDNLYHLWFLWHLIVFYIATFVAVQVSRRFESKSSPNHFLQRINQLVRSDWGMIVFAAISVIFLAQMKSLPGNLDSAFGFVPPWYVLGIYGLCYLYGWFLFQNRLRLKRLGVHANIRIVIGVGAVGAYLGLLGWYLKSGQPEFLKWILVILSAISIWTLIEGWLALFQKYCRTPSRPSRYIADSSYWVYLIHVPVMLVCQGMVANIKLVAEVKFLVVLIATTVICFLSYHFFVRATLIGRFLNGRRYSIWPLKPAAPSPHLHKV